jgi:N-acetylglucosaminyl-diphospho-decaprenol L-rhamnosyltransferase
MEAHSLETKNNSEIRKSKKHHREKAPLMISVVTVNYKTIDYTLKMLESLFEFHQTEDVEVFVVENGSGDDLTELAKTFPEVRIIESEKNLGFAGGCNLAIKEARGEYVILINPDIVFTDNALTQMVREMNQSKQTGIGGASLRNLDGTQQDCVWSFPTPTDQLLLLLKWNHVFPNLRPFKKWLMKDFDYSTAKNVDQVMGAFFCIRRELLTQIGLLDDGFFIWYEEVDYCKRAKEAGWGIRFFSNITALHKKGSSFDRVPTIKKQAVLRKSIRRYITKHHGRLVGTFFLLCEPIFFVMSVIASVLKPV